MNEIYYSKVYRERERLLKGWFYIVKNLCGERVLRRKITINMVNLWQGEGSVWRCKNLKFSPMHLKHAILHDTGWQIFFTLPNFSINHQVKFSGFVYFFVPAIYHKKGIQGACAVLLMTARLKEKFIYSAEERMSWSVCIYGYGCLHKSKKIIIFSTEFNFSSQTCLRVIYIILRAKTKI